MKLLFDVREQNRNVTGIGTYVRNLGRELRALRRPGVECVCVPPGVPRPPTDGKPGRPATARLANFARNLSWKQVYLPLRAAREKARVLVCLDPVSPLRSPVPTAIVIYDLIFLTGRAQSDAWTRYWRWLVPRCARRADLVFAPSRETRDRITQQLGVPADKVVVFRSGVAPHFRPLDPRVRQSAGGGTPPSFAGPLDPQAWGNPAPGSPSSVPGSIDLAARETGAGARPPGLPERFLLTVGAHDPRRNLKAVLAALAALKARGSLCHQLVAIGPRTPYFQEILRETSRLGLERDVIFLDYVPNEELPLYYGLADLYLYPSLAEGFGLTPLEAMACGCPVVTSRVSSLPEVTGEAALTVNPSDPAELVRAVERVLTDPSLRDELVRKGLERAGGFSWRSGAEDILEACLRLG